MKRNGKRTAIALTIAMMLPATSGTALAASPEIHPSHIATATKSEEKLPERATQIVDALEKLEPALKALTKRTIVKNEMDENLLNLNLESPESNDMSATVVFDRITGELFMYSASLYIWKQGEIATDEIILQRAEKAVLELLGADKRKQAGSPQLSKAVKKEDPEDLTDNSTRYRSVYYPVELNGLEILGNRMGIFVSTDYAGHILGVSSELLDLKVTKVPDPKTALTPEAAKKQFFTPDRLDLGYVLEGKDAKPGMQFALMNNAYIDAVTGKQIDFTHGTELAGNGKRNPENLKNITLSPKGESLIVKSRADGEKVVASLFGVDTKKMFTEYYTEEVDGEFIHSWRDDEFGYEGVSISVDVSTGEVTSTDIFMETKSLPVPLSKEEALKKAISFIEPYVDKSSTEWQVEIFDPYKQPKLADWMIELNEGEGDEEEESTGTGPYTFIFYELHNGFPVFDRYYWMKVDIENGQVFTFIVNLPEKEGTLPILKPSVTEQQAAEIVAKNLPVKLSYFWPTYNGKQAPFLTLVYTVDKSKGWPYVDAVNGTLEWGEYEE
ncbi:YcdB/YcdC domain-containing protein [Brevibacillus porteri]|uniref:YcdB/YcdC domain-containing protein n=1 Tax=Brevibacillus porteri TaxID=2126350 RepID=UPI003D2441AA